MDTCVRASLPLSFQLVLDIHQPVILCHPLAPGRSTGLQVASPETHGQVCDEIVRGLARTMRYEDVPAKLGA